MSREWDLRLIERELKAIYEDNFLNNFLSYVMIEGGKSHPRYIKPFAQSTHSVALCIDYMVQQKEAARQHSKRYFLLKEQGLAEKLSVESDGLYPNTKFRRSGFNKNLRFDDIDMSILADLMNEKLEATAEHLICGIEMKKIKTIDQCTQLYFNRYMQITESMALKH